LKKSQRNGKKKGGKREKITKLREGYIFDIKAIEAVTLK